MRLGAIGDVVRTLPSLHLIRKRFPAAWIAWAVEEKSLEILLGNPDLDEIILAERQRWAQLLKNPFKLPEVVSEISKFLSGLRRKKFDTVVDFHSSIKSGIISLATGAAERIGYTARYSREFNFLFNNIRMSLRQKRVSRMERNFTLLRHFGIEAGEMKGNKPSVMKDSMAGDEKEMIKDKIRSEIKEESRNKGKFEIQAEIVVSDEDRIYIDCFLKRENLEDNKRIIVYPGASRRQAYKKWDADNYASLAGMLVKNTEFALILAWGPGEMDECQEIARKAKASIWFSPSLQERIRIAPETSLKQLAELIRRCHLFIGGDTGAMHISCAVRTPCVVLYGPTDPVINAPWGEHYRVVHDDAIACSPCRKRSCRKGTCFENLTPEVVFKETQDFIKEMKCR
ncbi:MAG: glycosyltransferase family 9 protein [Acidobacteriota bacterium]